MSVCVRVCVYACMRVCVCACVRVCVCVSSEKHLGKKNLTGDLGL